MRDVRQNDSLVRFSVFELDPSAGELRKKGVKIRLQQQPFQVLQVLLERPGELVTREELQKRLWPSTFVDEDHGLYNAVKKLREALGDESDTPRFIETVPKRGYRFIGTLNGNGAAVPRSRLIFAVAAAALVVGALLIPRLRVKAERASASNPSSPSKSNSQQHFLEGRYHADQAFEAAVFKSGSMKKSEEEFAKGVSLLEESIREDPSYVPAYLQLAQTIMSEPPHVELLPKARTALIKSLSLDGTNPEAHLLMANYLWFELEGGWDEPEIHYKTAIQLRPDFAQGHEAYAEFLDDLGQFEAGIKEHQRAQMLDPNTDYLSSSPLTPRPVQLERYRKFMKVSAPNGWDFWRCGELEFEAGQYAEALKDWSTVARIYGWNEEATAWERAYVRGGSQALIAEVATGADAVAKERYLPREILIIVHRGARDRDGTLAWLAIAAKEHNPLVRHLRSDHRWDPYRSDPQFQAIAGQEGLP
jgi:DNA-binding winged helix-turn-helix (wHTH) protein